MTVLCSAVRCKLGQYDVPLPFSPLPILILCLQAPQLGTDLQFFSPDYSRLQELYWERYTFFKCRSARIPCAGKDRSDANSRNKTWSTVFNKYIDLCPTSIWLLAVRIWMTLWAFWESTSKLQTEWTGQGVWALWVLIPHSPSQWNLLWSGL